MGMNSTAHPAAAQRIASTRASQGAHWLLHSPTGQALVAAGGLLLALALVWLSWFAAPRAMDGPLLLALVSIPVAISFVWTAFLLARPGLTPGLAAAGAYVASGVLYALVGSAAAAWAFGLRLLFWPFFLLWAEGGCASGLFACPP